MDFDLSPAEEQFRAQVRQFLDDNLGADVPRDRQFYQQWLVNVRAKRWVGFSWPTEVGGGGASLLEQVILKEEMAKRNAPPLGTSFMGLAWVGPGIIQYGTEAQKKRFIPDILDSKVNWCTGYSEPNVGSDLASVQTKALRSGDAYVVNGQKIWTSGAPWADWIILLCRTSWDPQHKHEGITCLLVDMKTPGIEVRPIENMAGGANFASVFFTDVHVPAENRLGEEGKGWAVTVSALANERSSIGEVTGLYQKLEQLRELVKTTRKGGQEAASVAGIRKRLARIEARIEAMRLNGMRYLTKQLHGEPLSSETSVNKLHRAELEVEMGEFAVELLGQAGLQMKGTEGAVAGGRWATDVLSWPNVVIGGGTPNIQKNIIAERILGLPKD